MTAYLTVDDLLVTITYIRNILVFKSFHLKIFNEWTERKIVYTHTGIFVKMKYLCLNYN